MPWCCVGWQHSCVYSSDVASYVARPEALRTETDSFWETKSETWLFQSLVLCEAVTLFGSLPQPQTASESDCLSTSGLPLRLPLTGLIVEAVVAWSLQREIVSQAWTRGTLIVKVCCRLISSQASSVIDYGATGAPSLTPFTHISGDIQPITMLSLAYILHWGLPPALVVYCY